MYVCVLVCVVCCLLSRELKSLASDCIDRSTKMFEVEIRRQNPSISESNLRSAVEKERAAMMPGKNKEEAHKEMVTHNRTDTHTRD